MVIMQAEHCRGGLPQKAEVYCFHVRSQSFRGFIQGQLLALEDGSTAMLYHGGEPGCWGQTHRGPHPSSTTGLCDGVNVPKPLFHHIASQYIQIK